MLYQNRLAAFEYDSDWITEGFSISPFSLPLQKKVFMPKTDPFEGLFNVFAHNRDDHSKNFTFMYRESEKKWVLSPAYDLTYSSSIGGEHATTVNGNGINPGMDDILAVAKKIGLNITKAKKTASDIKECVFEMLDDWIR